MNEVYPFCHLCESSLTEGERAENKENDNLYVPLCSECVERAIDHIFDALKR